MARRNRFFTEQTFNPSNALYFEEHSETVTKEQMAMDQFNAQVCINIKRGRCHHLYIHNGKQHHLDHFNDFMMYPQVPMGRNTISRQWEWLGWLSFFVSKSTNLKSVEISDGENGKMNQRRIATFIDALVQNKSIQQLKINADIGSINFSKLNTLFRNNNNLKGISFQCMNSMSVYSANRIAHLSLCCPGTSLRCISIEHITKHSKSIPFFTRSLSHATELKELTFYNNNLDTKSCAALAIALGQCPEPKLKTLIMIENTFSTGCLLPLAIALQRCHQLKVLHIDEPLETIDIVSLSTLFKSEHCKLERLRIAVESVYIPRNIVGELLLHALSPQRFLSYLNLDSSYLGDVGIRILRPGITTMGNLKILSLRNNNIIDSIGDIMAANSSLEVINLDYNLIGDQALAALAATDTPPRLKQFTLAGNRISSTGLTHFSELIQRRDHLLCLDLAMNSIGERGILILAGFLRGNNSLNHLHIDEQLTERSCEVLGSILCNSTSLTTIETSNHQLTGSFTSLSGNSRLQRELMDYFQMNRQGCKRAITWKVAHSFDPRLVSVGTTANERRMLLLIMIEIHDKVINILSQPNGFSTMMTTVHQIRCSRLTTIFEYVTSSH